MDRGSRPVRAAWVVGLVLLLFAGAKPAYAAFPGRNGLLVVEPASGNGLVVVGADGRHPRQVCAVAQRCDGARDPVWSPDGSEIAFASFQATDSNLGVPQPYVVYPDGSCLACPVPWTGVNFYVDAWDRNFGPRFLRDGRLAVSLDTGYPPSPQVGVMNTDGIGFQPFAVSGAWQQPAWSSTGQLAAVRFIKGSPEVFVIDARTGSARQLTHDGALSPNWSPDGRRLAVVHRGWIELIASGGGRPRRLTRGGAPAWAPDGRELAFVGAHDRLFVIRARGGRPRPVGRIRAQRVDWQPLTGQAPRCQVPIGSIIAAASPEAKITIDIAPNQGYAANGPFSVLGCLTSDGRQRLLESMPPGGEDAVFAVGTVVVASDYAALVNDFTDPHYGDSNNAVEVFDLRTGTAVPNRGGESVGCPEYCISGVDQLVLGPDGDTAAHTFVVNGGASTTTTVEQIVANDSTGTHILDTITTTGPFNPTPSALSHLALSGRTLTWNHAGTPESAQLN